VQIHLQRHVVLSLTTRFSASHSKVYRPSGMRPLHWRAPRGQKKYLEVGVQCFRKPVYDEQCVDLQVVAWRWRWSQLVGCSGIPGLLPMCVLFRRDRLVLELLICTKLARAAGL
jgi:hypothetical protein